MQLAEAQHVPATPFVDELQLCPLGQAQFIAGKPAVGLARPLPHADGYAVAQVVCAWQLFVFVLQTLPPVHALRQLMVLPQPSSSVAPHWPG